ncbi:hypothetical protein D9M73_272710 [compost metagenome]
MDFTFGQAQRAGEAVDHPQGSSRRRLNTAQPGRVSTAAQAKQKGDRAVHPGRGKPHRRKDVRRQTLAQLDLRRVL